MAAEVEANTFRRTPEGSLRWMTTSEGPLASTASTDFQNTFPRVLIRPQRFSEATTSAAVISLPVWNLTPLRNVIVYRRPPSDTVWPSARWGMGLQSLSR